MCLKQWPFPAIRCSLLALVYVPTLNSEYWIMPPKMPISRGSGPSHFYFRAQVMVEIPTFRSVCYWLEVPLGTGRSRFNAIFNLTLGNFYCPLHECHRQWVGCKARPEHVWLTSFLLKLQCLEKNRQQRKEENHVWFTFICIGIALPVPWISTKYHTRSYLNEGIHWEKMDFSVV